MDRETQWLLKAVASDKGLQEAEILRAAEGIAFHESKLDPQAEQQGGGPGRGLFQYEIGENASAVTARNRAIAAFKRYKMKPPAWLTRLPDTFNPAELDPDQQLLLFIGDHRERPNSDFSDLKKLPLDEWWGRYHQTQNDPKKREQFRNDYKFLLERKAMNQRAAFSPRRAKSGIQS